MSRKSPRDVRAAINVQRSRPGRYLRHVDRHGCRGPSPSTRKRRQEPPEPGLASGVAERPADVRACRGSARSVQPPGSERRPPRIEHGRSLRATGRQEPGHRAPSHTARRSASAGRGRDCGRTRARGARRAPACGRSQTDAPWRLPHDRHDLPVWGEPNGPRRAAAGPRARSASWTCARLLDRRPVSLVRRSAGRSRAN